MDDNGGGEINPDGWPETNTLSIKNGKWLTLKTLTRNSWPNVGQTKTNTLSMKIIEWTRK